MSLCSVAFCLQAQHATVPFWIGRLGSACNRAFLDWSVTWVMAEGSLTLHFSSSLLHPLHFSLSPSYPPPLWAFLFLIWCALLVLQRIQEMWKTVVFSDHEPKAHSTEAVLKPQLHRPVTDVPEDPDLECSRDAPGMPLGKLAKQKHVTRGRNSSGAKFVKLNLKLTLHLIGHFFFP